jgi:hypothetical protein
LTQQEQINQKIQAIFDDKFSPPSSYVDRSVNDLNMLCTTLRLHLQFGTSMCFIAIQDNDDQSQPIP